MLNHETLKARLPPSAITEFQEIYRNEFGEELNADAAKEMAERLLRLYAVFASDDWNSSAMI